MGQATSYPWIYGNAWNKEALSYKVDSSKQTRAILVNLEKDNSM